MTTIQLSDIVCCHLHTADCLLLIAVLWVAEHGVQVSQLADDTSCCAY